MSFRLLIFHSNWLRLPSKVCGKGPKTNIGTQILMFEISVLHYSYLLVFCYCYLYIFIFTVAIFNIMACTYVAVSFDRQNNVRIEPVSMLVKRDWLSVPSRIAWLWVWHSLPIPSHIHLYYFLHGMCLTAMWYVSSNGCVCVCVCVCARTRTCVCMSVYRTSGVTSAKAKVLQQDWSPHTRALWGLQSCYHTFSGYVLFMILL